MTKHTDPKPYIETDDAEGNCIRVGTPATVDAEDTEGNNAKCFEPAVSAEGEKDDTEGNGINGRF
jgi:hypothetical protein